MYKNIEIKYKVRNPLGLKNFLKKHPRIAYQYIHHQRDIYFDVPDGRLKIRIEEGQNPALIRYHRPDCDEPRPSEYSIEQITYLPPRLRELQQKYGIKGQVEKWRELYLYENVRIHLDNVTRLGWFLELESVISDEFPEAKAIDNLNKVQGYLQDFISDAVSVSYIDLISGIDI